MPLGPQNIDLFASLNNLRNGDLPTRARLRLAEEAGPHRKLFTSDLSVSEFLLSREVGCQPISQVMGCSIYHIGKIPDYKGKTGEMDIISSAQREARRLALHRLFLEAQAIGADAVIGVRMEERLVTRGSHGKGGDDGDEVVEFVVVGTGVRAPWIQHPPQTPIISDLSGQDLWALARDGFAPCGMIFDFCRYHVWHVLDENPQIGELQSAVTSVDAARRIVLDRVMEQAKRLGAEFVVGSDIKVEVREVSCGWEGCHRNDVDIDVSWFATGVKTMRPGERPAKANLPPLVLGMMPLGRKKRAILEEEDESAELAKQGREEEERAAEADEGGKE
ncbi:MAG: heavy metal-binding domain-containing protein [Thermoanaerobaculia bacterium]